MSAAIPVMLEIAVRAVYVRRCELEVKRAKAHLNQAYTEWREEAGIEHVQRYSAEWDATLEATRDTFMRCKSVKRAHYNAKRRLDSFIAKADGSKPRTPQPSPLGYSQC